MNSRNTIVLSLTLVFTFLCTTAFAQTSGDFRTQQNGNWADAATWQMYDGSAWVDASAAPTGSENITILNGDTVTVASSVNVTGHVTVEGDGIDAGPPFEGGELSVDGGTLTFADGSVYQHDRNGGDIPTATWDSGSTVMLTGIIDNDPDGIGQQFYNFEWNNPDQVENINIGWDAYTLLGNMTVLNTNGNQFRMTSAPSDGHTRVITINGNVVVDGDNAEFTTTGSGDITDYDVTVKGDVTVQNGGFLSVSRGSGGMAVWTLEGDLTVDNGKLGESNIDKHGQRKSFVFAGSGSQTITGNNVETESTLYYEIASGSDVSVAAGKFPVDSLTVQGGLTLNGELVANGEVVLDGGTMTVADGGTYNHAHDGGAIPMATWEIGSTVKLTGIVANDPDNGDQNFYNYTWDNPDQIENINIGWDAYELRGDMTVLNTAGNQFRMTSGPSDGHTRVITIDGDVIVDGDEAEFTTTGSGDITGYEVTVKGDVFVRNGGFLSVSRGSGGMAVWTLEGDLNVQNGKLGESNIDKHGQRKSFVFAGSGGQMISGDSVETESTLYYEISSGTDVTVAEGSHFPVDSLTAQGDLTLNGELIANGEVVLDGGNMTVAAGGTYNHAHDGGAIPMATWADSSTVKITGVQANDPDNGDQDFYNYTWDNPDQIENINIGWDGYTLRGNMTVLNTAGHQFRLTSASDHKRMITINGDVIAKGSQTEFTTTGSGDSAYYQVDIRGNLSVTDSAYVNASRGSGGRAVWNLYGDLTVDNAKLGDSQNHDYARSYVFAADTVSENSPQNIMVNEISYNGDVYFTVADSSAATVKANSDFAIEDTLFNEGMLTVEDNGQLRFKGGAVYDHMQDGGHVPTATWEEGSTAYFGSIVTAGPANASQDFYNIVVNSPNNVNNVSFEMNGNTVRGDIDILNTGSARVYLTQPESFEDRVVTIMGDIYVNAENGAFSSNGTGSGESSITVHDYGDIKVDNGNFSISRGSGPIVTWYMYKGSVDFNDGKTQNSNPRSASAFVFTGDTTHVVDIAEAVDISHFPVEVDSGATLNVMKTNFNGSSDNFTVDAGGTLAVTDTAGFGDNLDVANLSLSSEGNYVLNGSEEQVTGFNLPLLINDLTIDNEAGVKQSRAITVNGTLTLANGELDNSTEDGASLLMLGPDGKIKVINGSLTIPIDGLIVEYPEPPYAVGDTVNVNGSFGEAELGPVLGSNQLKAWFLASDGGSYEVVDDAQDGDGHALQFSLESYNGSGNDWENEAVNENYNVEAGDTYEISIYAKADKDTRVANFYLGLPEAGSYTRQMENEETLATDWTEYSYTYKAVAADSVGMRFSTAMNYEANEGGTITIDNLTVTKVKTDTTSVGDEPATPDKFALEQNYPNPFNPTTTINYQVPQQSHVTVKVYNLMGREVAELVNSNKAAGSYSIDWNASNYASGVYFYRMTAGDFTATKKLTLLK